ncbi:MAG: RDD family protein [Pseudomonadota bacterium]
MTTTRLDTTFDIATPEGVELQLPVAGLAPRSLAWLIDSAIKFVIFFTVQLVAELLGDFGMGVLALNAFAVLWLYNVLFEVFMNGATPGKRVLGLRVVNADGTPVGWSGSIVRNLIRPVDVLPGVYTIGLISVLLTSNLQRLGDLAANTVVVFTTREARSGDFVGFTPRPVNIPLTPDEQNAVVSYGERAPVLNRERADELATIVSPLFNDAKTEDLVSHAAWLVGRGR